MVWKRKYIFYMLIISRRYRILSQRPRHIQELIDNPDNRTAAGAKQIEQVIRDDKARQPLQDTPGGEREKTNIAERTGERPNLSATSTTKDGRGSSNRRLRPGPARGAGI